MKAIITYETQHGSAKKAADIIAEKLNIRCINVDTPFEAEDMSKYDTLICTFNFRGPYTAQLTKLFLNRIAPQMKNKNLILVGEGLFSQKEFPVVAEGIHKSCPCRNFETYFINGQLRVATLTSEEQALLGKFSEITKMVIQDMGEFDEAKAHEVAADIETKINSYPELTQEELKSNRQWVCSVCGYVHTGESAPEACPLCGAPAAMFTEK